MPCSTLYRVHPPLITAHVRSTAASSASTAFPDALPAGAFSAGVAVPPAGSGLPELRKPGRRLHNIFKTTPGAADGKPCALASVAASCSVPTALPAR